jgi:hypothetical protein
MGMGMGVNPYPPVYMGDPVGLFLCREYGYGVVIPGGYLPIAISSWRPIHGVATSKLATKKIRPPPRLLPDGNHGVCCCALQCPARTRWVGSCRGCCLGRFRPAFCRGWVRNRLSLTSDGSRAWSWRRQAMGTRLLSLGNSGGIRFWLERQARADRLRTRVDAGIRPALAFGGPSLEWSPRGSFCRSREPTDVSLCRRDLFPRSSRLLEIRSHVYRYRGCLVLWTKV